MKQKGFMLVEALIASTIILGALIYLFIQFSSIKMSYDTSFEYDTIPSLYKSRELANFISSNNTDILNSNLSINTNQYTQFTKEFCTNYSTTTVTNLCQNIIDEIDSKQILYTNSNIEALQRYLNSTGYDQTTFDDGFKKYILSLDKNGVKNTNRRLIIEYNDGTFANISLNI